MWPSRVGIDRVVDRFGKTRVFGRSRARGYQQRRRYRRGCSRRASISHRQLRGEPFAADRVRPPSGRCPPTAAGMDRARVAATRGAAPGALAAGDATAATRAGASIPAYYWPTDVESSHVAGGLGSLPRQSNPELPSLSHSSHEPVASGQTETRDRHPTDAVASTLMTESPEEATEQSRHSIPVTASATTGGPRRR